MALRALQRVTTPIKRVEIKMAVNQENVVAGTNRPRGYGLAAAYL